MKIGTSIYALLMVVIFSVQPDCCHSQPDQANSVAAARITPADPKATRSALDRAIGNIAEPQKYLLRYKLNPDTEWSWDGEQSTSTRTRMAGTSKTSTARTQWTTIWNVQKVDGRGNMSFESRVDRFSMWQQIDDNPPTSIDSSSQEQVPDEFQSIADNLKPRPSRFTIAPNGQIVRRESSTNQKLIGYSDISVPLPAEPVSPGFQWFVNRELTATDEDKSKVRLAVRTNYELTKVVENRAFLSFRTEVLTPGLSPTIRSQIMQNMTRGYIIFDIEKGLPVYRETEWNEKVQAFSGVDSFLMYTAKTIEKLAGPVPQTVELHPSRTTLTNQLLTPISDEKAAAIVPQPGPGTGEPENSGKNESRSPKK